MDVELEHGLHDLLTNLTGDEPTITGKIPLAHLKEFPDYYTPRADGGESTAVERPQRLTDDTGAVRTLLELMRSEHVDQPGRRSGGRRSSQTCTRRRARVVSPPRA